METDLAPIITALADPSDAELARRTPCADRRHKQTDPPERGLCRRGIGYR